MNAPLPTLRQKVVLSQEDHLTLLADEVLGNLDAGRPDVAITNLVQAVMVGYGIDRLTPALSNRLNRIIVRGGGFQ